MEGGGAGASVDRVSKPGMVGRHYVRPARAGACVPDGDSGLAQPARAIVASLDNTGRMIPLRGLSGALRMTKPGICSRDHASQFANGHWIGRADRGKDHNQHRRGAHVDVADSIMGIVRQALDYQTSSRVCGAQSDAGFSHGRPTLCRTLVEAGRGRVRMQQVAARKQQNQRDGKCC